MKKNNKNCEVIPVQRRWPQKAIDLRERFLADRFALPFLLLLAFIVRMIALGRAELWQDEIGFANIVANPQMTPWEVMGYSWDMVISIAQLPFALVIQNIYMRILQPYIPDILFKPFFLKLPMVFLGTFSVLGVYRLGGQVFNRAIGYAAAIMTAVFFYPVYYSREVYCYAHVIFFSSFGLYLFFKASLNEQAGTGTLFFLLLCLLGLSFSHFAGAMLLFVLCLTCAIWFLFAKFRIRDVALSKKIFKVGLVCAACMLAIAPFVLRFLTANKAHKAGSTLTLWTIVNDGISKLFLGERAWGVGLAWICLGIGMLFLLWGKDMKGEKKVFLMVVLATLGLITWTTHRSQYLSARYFSPIAPACYIVFAYGIFQFSRLPVLMNVTQRIGVKDFVRGVYSGSGGDSSVRIPAASVCARSEIHGFWRHRAMVE